MAPIVVLRGALLGLALVIIISAPAVAHGKQIELEISSVAATEVAPLARTFEVVAIYQDREPVDDGTATLTASHFGSGDVVDAELAMAAERPGVFTGTVAFTDVGDWDISVTITSPSGSGTADFTQAVAAPSSATPTSSPGSAPATEPAGDDRVQTQVTFGFGLTDVANIAIRVLHFTTAVLWTALVAALLVGYAWLDGDERVTGPTRRWVRRLTPLLLVGMVLSGVLQAWKNAPNTGGVAQLSTLLQLPFGEVYVGLLAAKSLAFPILAVLLWRLRSHLRLEVATVNAPAVVRLAWVSAGVLTTVYAIVIVMNYLHLVSHLAEFYL